ncbi:MAG: universal stress protein [Rhodobacteraceae bacterium]|uniref:Universal stress protein n=1 Tax=Thioclava marina TaxID=1915077 RepID=A0ABX3MNG9_9RHOB|nr:MULTISPECIES: universal stress protein [Thioclava]TNE82684.1 MAG: universal stress protein [Paracoccaceae bacterium]MBD3803272.1 universal stress protein [Thioclava sp.]OOY13064.1 universal stress protein [Thioclava marina]OOY28779.1 universal stress protein [Thioclava sp. L04-15]TNF10259.1 MAG: universal stress protein [Paracoccaceae bacterium]
MTKTILCAIDINRPKTERKVLEWAEKLATMEGAQLDVITVVPDYGSAVVGAFFSDDHTAKAKEHAHDLLAKFVSEVIGAEANSKVRHIVGVGTAYHEIISVAEKDGADLIVLGAHRPDLSDYLLGPNAARVVRHSNCSVFVVR